METDKFQRIEEYKAAQIYLERARNTIIHLSQQNVSQLEQDALGNLIGHLNHSISLAMILVEHAVIEGQGEG